MDHNAASRAEAMNYKLRKEAFVSNLSGSSLTDINLVTLVAASAILLWTALSKQGLVVGSNAPLVYTIDFLLNVCAILLAFTAYSSAPLFLNLALIAPAILWLLPLQQQQRSRQGGDKNTSSKSSKNDSSKRALSNVKPKYQTGLEQTKQIEPGTLIVRPFLTNYRGAMLIATALAILAVDFHIFPRRFAKVETWGTSLMDLGVGSFVFSAGVVGARAVIRGSQSAQSSTGLNILGRVQKACKHSIPLLILGVARLVSVKNLDYAEHVTEYGVHWNFFFTLGLLPPFVEAIDCCLDVIKGQVAQQTISFRRSIRYDLIALSISLCYELVLNNTQLLAFILISPRTPESSLLAKNREGVFSFFGYLAIFLSGRSTGVLACQFQFAKDTKRTKAQKGLPAAQSEKEKITLERRTVILPELAFRAIVFSGLYMLSSSVYGINLTVSRRLANLPYILWIISFNNAQLFLFALIEALGPKFVFSKFDIDAGAGDREEVVEAKHIASPIMQAFNGNGLAIFLVANLGTGFVNFTFNTLDMSNAGALTVLLIYACCLTILAVGLKMNGVSIRI